MSALQSLVTALNLEQQTTVIDAQALEDWLKPINELQPTGEEPSYLDDFQTIREEVNLISGADTELICNLAKTVLTKNTKDIRVVTYYTWACLQREGEVGFAQGLELLVIMLQRFENALHPQRERSRKAALDWLASARVLDSLSLHPEVIVKNLQRIVAALLQLEQITQLWETAEQPNLSALYAALELRLEKSGGAHAVVPQNFVAEVSSTADIKHTPAVIKEIASGRELLDQVRLVAKYLRDQPNGWLAAHHLMKSVRHDTLHQLPKITTTGYTQIDSPKPDQRALLKRLYLQQSWLELLEQADNMFSRGACHFWLDLQWYIYQALSKAGNPYDSWADIIKQDLKGLLTRLPGLESLLFSDGTPFADETTLNWINQHVIDSEFDWGHEPVVSGTDNTQDTIFALETEALALADAESPEAAMAWLQDNPNNHSMRNQWLIRFLMARVADQFGRNEMALHLVNELDQHAALLSLSDWEPKLLFEVKARRLKLLRMKSPRSETEKEHLQQEMEKTLAGLITIDPVRAMILCS
ncbi:type VI secretion system protein TssA [Pseudomonas sp. F1_0610]|uniref:type VI secretion system protein TssA n=1 Tax=Pseudomonas sp. F1_0610 TaxID=3114284 RepID=UPI0039C290EC